MSIKDFHIIFIIAAIIISFGFAYWAFLQYIQLSSGSYMLTSVVSLLIGISLIIYEIKFIQKIRNIV